MTMRKVCKLYFKETLKRMFHVDHLIIVLFTFAQLLIIGLFVFNISFLNPIATALKNFSITDTFFEIQHSEQDSISDDLITLVDIKELYSREDIGLLIEQIGEENPLVIGIDIIFEGIKDDSLGNSILIESVEKVKDISVFANKLTDYSSEKRAFQTEVKSFFADSIKVSEGFTNLTDNMQGATIRECVTVSSLNEEKCLSFPAKIAMSIDSTLEVEHDKPNLINYKNTKFNIVKYNEIKYKRDLIDGHVVLLGTIGEEADMHNSPIGKISGIEIQAYTLLMMLEHQKTHKVPGLVNLLFAFILCYIFELILHKTFKSICSYQKNPFMVFLKKSNLVTFILLSTMLVSLCWFFYYTFIKFDVVFDGTLILASIALVCESRDIYQALIISLKTKYKWRFLYNSIMIND